MELARALGQDAEFRDGNHVDDATEDVFAFVLEEEFKGGAAVAREDDRTGARRGRRQKKRGNLLPFIGTIPEAHQLGLQPPVFGLALPGPGRFDRREG
jgi:hypothetical protein